MCKNEKIIRSDCTSIAWRCGPHKLYVCSNYLCFHSIWLAGHHYRKDGCSFGIFSPSEDVFSPVPNLVRLWNNQSRLDPTIRDAATCNVPLLTLVGLPFLLKQGNIVKVKLIPVNLIGEGLPSAINSVGALVETVPSKPPVSPTKNPTTTQT